MGEDGNRLWAFFEKRLASRESLARAVIHTFLYSPATKLSRMLPCLPGRPELSIPSRYPTPGFVTM
jgi:hypothetical protein